MKTQILQTLFIHLPAQIAISHPQATKQQFETLQDIHENGLMIAMLLAGIRYMLKERLHERDPYYYKDNTEFKKINF